MNNAMRNHKNLTRAASTQVSVRELKARLSRYVARARAGEVIEVTAHGKVVAQLTGIASPNATGLARLMAIGAVQWRGGKPDLAPAVRLTAVETSVGDSVIEDRG